MDTRPLFQRHPARIDVPPALLVDLYELTMVQSYLVEGMNAPATFSLFARHLPPNWGFFVAAGLESIVEFLEAFSFSSEGLNYLESTGLFTGSLIDWLRTVRFTGSVRAMPEGTVFFPDEPLLEVTAPLMEAQLVETAIVNQVHLQTLITSKAARSVQAAAGHRLVDFGLRRTHGIDAGLKVARSAYLAGFDATSNVLAGQQYDIPIAGTMAHSYVQVFGEELGAFRSFARAFPDASVFLIDTYDVETGAKHAATVGQEMQGAGHRLQGVRLDSGDVIAQSFMVRTILDDAGLHDATIFVSGSVDEHLIAKAVAKHAPIDAFGVGTKLGVSADAPYLDMAYKLVAYDNQPTLKLSAGKATWPGAKQVWRTVEPNHLPVDTIATADEPGPINARALLVQVMADGKGIGLDSLAEARARTRTEIDELPIACKSIVEPTVPRAHFSDRLLRLRDQCVAKISRAESTPIAGE